MNREGYSFPVCVLQIVCTPPLTSSPEKNWGGPSFPKFKIFFCKSGNPSHDLSSRVPHESKKLMQCFFFSACRISVLMHAASLKLYSKLSIKINKNKPSVYCSCVFIFFKNACICNLYSVTSLIHTCSLYNYKPAAIIFVLSKNKKTKDIKRVSIDALHLWVKWNTG